MYNSPFNEKLSTRPVIPVSHPHVPCQQTRFYRRPNRLQSRCRRCCPPPRPPHLHIQKQGCHVLLFKKNNQLPNLVDLKAKVHESEGTSTSHSFAHSSFSGTIRTVHHKRSFHRVSNPLVPFPPPQKEDSRSQSKQKILVPPPNRFVFVKDLTGMSQRLPAYKKRTVVSEVAIGFAFFKVTTIS